MGFLAGFGQQGIIQGDDDGSGFRNRFQERLPDRAKEDGKVHPVPVKKPIIGGPILKLPSTGGEQSGNSPSTEAGQSAEGWGA